MPSILPDAVIDPDRVLPLPAWCERNGFSEATGRRLIKSGEGPTVTWLSKRRWAFARDTIANGWTLARVAGCNHPLERQNAAPARAAFCVSTNPAANRVAT